MIKLDFTNHLAAQDMIKIIEVEKHIPASAAIGFSVNSENYHSILQTGWADIALSLWGHDDPERKWNKMNNPCMDVELNEEKVSVINCITKKYKVDNETAVSYFLIFTMDSLGYHI